MSRRHASPGLSLRFRASMILLAAFVVAALHLTVQTHQALIPAPASLSVLDRGVTASEVLDRRGIALNVSLENEWNVHRLVALHEIPAFLREAFIHAEDKRFFDHGGADWRARLAAVFSNMINGEAVRGASTISEQVVRMLRPRPRTIWTKWLEGFEAARLERRFSKDEILEFYLNQVPYAANRRGVGSAARYYFARDLDTLSRKEMLTLAVLVRSPSRLDLYRSTSKVDGAVERLADLMQQRGVLDSSERDAILAQTLKLHSPQLTVSAPHFVRFVEQTYEQPGGPAASIMTTLDAGLQRKVQDLVDTRIDELADGAVADAGVLVVDNATGQVLVWAVAGGGKVQGPRTHIDTVLTPRQPGSAMKPFLYALAIDSGWSAAQVIDDAPLAAEIGTGLHQYSNYSRRFYGPVTLRDALGNSLNIPALKTLRFVGAPAYLQRLRALGFERLDAHPDFYGDGIALGNGAVSLFELTQAYAALANGGEFSPLRYVLDEREQFADRQRVFSTESASLIANILSDAEARTLEFGRDSVLTFPFQTAVKTGTSSDHRDVWAVAFNASYTVGIWMGNLDQTPTQGLTGSTGPALLLRGVFSELMRTARPQPLFLSPHLQSRRVCVPMPGADVDCLERSEWFAAGEAFSTDPASDPVHRVSPDVTIDYLQPKPGLELAIDPRLPEELQAFEFALEGVDADDEVLWLIDGEHSTGRGERYLWPVLPGRHDVSASVYREGALIASLPQLSFTVR